MTSHTTLTKAASILATELRGQSHESLACHAANLTTQLDDLQDSHETMLRAIKALFSNMREAGVTFPKGVKDDVVEALEEAIARAGYRDEFA